MQLKSPKVREVQMWSDPDINNGTGTFALFSVILWAQPSPMGHFHLQTIAFCLLTHPRKKIYAFLAILRELPEI